MFNQDVIAAVKLAAHCRVSVLAAVPGWRESQVVLEVADELADLGYTDCQRGAGHWRVLDATAEQVSAEAARIRGEPVAIWRNDAPLACG